MIRKPSPKYHITGFESRLPKSLGEEITNFLNKNNDLELVNIKYSSFGILLSSNREENYSALVICKEK
jgi:Sporulation protein Cse60